MAKKKKTGDELDFRIPLYASKQEELMVKLTDEEKADEALNMVKALNEVDRLTHQLKGTKKRALEHQVAVTTGLAKRLVKIDCVSSYVNGRYTETRTDTGEVLTDRPLTDAEKQLELK